MQLKVARAKCGEVRANVRALAGNDALLRPFYAGVAHAGRVLVGGARRTAPGAVQRQVEGGLRRVVT